MFGTKPIIEKIWQNRQKKINSKKNYIFKSLLVVVGTSTCVLIILTASPFQPESRLNSDFLPKPKLYIEKSPKNPQKKAIDIVL